MIVRIVSGGPGFAGRSSSRARRGLWILTWISSWDPLKLCDAIRRTTSAPPGQNPAGQDSEALHSPLHSHHSNAPIEPVSQSNLSKIVALLIAIAARTVGSKCISAGPVACFGPHQRADRLALSSDPVDQDLRHSAALLPQRGVCSVSRATSKALLMGSLPRRRHPLRGPYFPRPYQAGYGFQLNML